MIQNDKEIFQNYSVKLYLENGYTKDELISWIKDFPFSEQHQQNFSAAENMVIALYPDFKNHYQILIDNGFMKKQEDSLIWLRSKKSLSEYFGNMWKHNNNNSKIDWKPIHILFNEKKLNQSFSRNGNTFYSESKDYIELKKILNITTL